MPELPILQELRSDLYGAMVDASASSRRRHRLVLSAGGLATAMAVAAVLVVTSNVDRGQVTPAPATAAEALRQAAGAAEHRAAPVPRDDQFYYVKSLASNLSVSVYSPTHVVTALVTKRREIWLSIGRRGRLTESLVGTHFFTHHRAQDRREAESVTRTGMSPERIYYLGGFKLSRRGLMSFPTDPHTIYRRLLANTHGAGHSPNGEVFTEIGDALRESPAPARLRAGLYRALALVPHVQFVGQVKDRAGRTGTAVAFTEVGLRHELIFDPQTSEMLAEREVIVDARKAQLRLPAGTVIEDTAYLRRAVTNEPR
jgi:hypothetical protein